MAHQWALPYPLQWQSLHGRAGGESHAISPLQPSLWLRHVDDPFIIWPCGEENVQSFHTHLNQFSPNIQFNIKREKEGRLGKQGGG